MTKQSKNKRANNSTPAVHERGFVLIGTEFLDIIFKKLTQIRRPIPVSMWEYVKQTGIVPTQFAWQFQPGAELFVREAYRPELKPNGDIYRYLEDKDSFVPPKMDKWKKIRWHSAFSMKKSHCRLFLRVVRFRMNIKSMTVTITIEIDRQRSKPQFWPKKSQMAKLKKLRKKAE